MNKLAARRLDEVTRVKLSRASCVTQIAKSLSFSFFSWLLADLSIDSGFLVHYDFLFSLCLFGFASAPITFHAKIGTSSPRFSRCHRYRCLLCATLITPWAVVLQVLLDPFSLSFFFSLSWLFLHAGFLAIRSMCRIRAERKCHVLSRDPDVITEYWYIQIDALTFRGVKLR